ncbi:hypothetical protein E2H14_19600 [Salmonella enterica subsp. enterica serovar Muenchen]|nr:hypothetical protein [Salmonella enterica subsp. enterica serovar Muenchen]
MKKTLIALAVAASAAVSGSAMAWDPSGTGGSVELGGTLTPQTKVTPWEIQIGAAVTNLDGFVQKGQQNVVIPVGNAIPVLGIRNAASEGFDGEPSIKPQIDYKGSVDIDAFKNGVSTVRMEVRNNLGSKIGSLEAPFAAAAVSSWSGGGNSPGSKALYASNDGFGFFGGLGKSAGAVRVVGSTEMIRGLSPDFVGKWKVQGSWVDANGEKFDNVKARYYGAYGSGIEAGAKIQIKLDAPAAADAIAWKASLPVTVSYQ